MKPAGPVVSVEAPMECVTRSFFSTDNSDSPCLAVPGVPVIARLLGGMDSRLQGCGLQKSLFSVAVTNNQRLDDL